MDFDVVIVGAGLVGAGLALALQDSGLKLAVVEARTPLPAASGAEWDSRVYAISPGNAAFLRACGVWDQLPADRICEIEEMRVYGDDMRSRLDFSAYDAGLRELAFTVENRVLQNALWQAVQSAPNIEIIAPAECESLALKADRARLWLRDGRMLDAQLIVGADGADSWVRLQVAIQVRQHNYHQQGVVANFRLGKMHHGIAYQWFGEDSVLALLPLPGVRASMVWSTGDAHAGHLVDLPHEELAREVGAASKGVLGELQVITPPAAFPLRLQRVSRLVQPRVALVGDAAHNVHPLAGQGVNLGFRDVRQLARVLTERGPQSDCGDYYLLRRYERERREDIAALGMATDGLHKLFASTRPGLAEVRNFGLRLVNRQLQLKNFFVKHAVG